MSQYETFKKMTIVIKACEDNVENVWVRIWLSHGIVMRDVALLVRESISTFLYSLNSVLLGLDYSYKY